MIEKEYGEYILICDVCGDATAGEGWQTFQEAVQHKRDNGWRWRKIDGEWEDICPECQGAE